MKYNYIIGILFSISLSAQSVFINEIHYDNSGGDINEAIEIAGPVGTDLSTYSILLYNGNGGTIYDTESLSGIIPDQQNGFGTLNFSIESIQNGPDAIALIDESGLLQFISYEGSILATEGIANGETSVNIGVAESGTTLSTESLQLTGTGFSYTDFIWSSPTAYTPGGINNAQVFDDVILSNQEFENLNNEVQLYPNPALNKKVSLRTSLNNEFDVTICNELGKKLSKQIVTGGENILIDELTTGMYFVQIRANENSVTKKLLVE